MYSILPSYSLTDKCHLTSEFEIDYILLHKRTIEFTFDMLFDLVLPNLNPYERIIMGYLEGLPAQRSSVVRIFLSSTFSGQTYSQYSPWVPLK